MLKECLKNNYYKGLLKWNEEKCYLLETCRFAQDKFKEDLDYFEIEYEE